MFKRGFILLWSGSIVDIPYGWTLCDGSFGSPDLRDRFVIGAGSSYNPGDNGGDVNHSHDFTADLHSHSIQSGGNLQSGTDYHQSTTSVAVTGTTDTAEHLPPYYALAYIFKK